MCRSQPLCCDADGITNGMLVCSLLCVPARRRRRRAPWGLGRGRARRGAGEVLCWKKLLVLLKDRLHYTVPNTLSGNPDTAERDTELSS